ncbi:MAG: hypothetical protein QOF28_2744 [Actinomycetota bacterium]|jgi:hypothetical protein|nr:hypothetical protein [Actinomycetota bacterium]
MIAVTLHDLVDKPEFGNAAAWAGGLGVVGIVVGLVWRRVWRRPAPVAGIIVAAAFAIAFHYSLGIPPNVERGLWLLAAAGVVTGFLAALWHPLIILGIGFALPGASLLTRDTGLLVHPHWVKTLVVATVVVGGTLVADFDRRYRARGWGPVLFAISTVGLYLTVPDTERAMLLLGAALPVLLLGWPFPLASLGAVGAYPCVGALAWVAAFDGRGRLSAIIGGVACLGLFAAEPVARVIRLSGPGVLAALPRRWWAAIVVGVGQAGLVAVAARLAGERSATKEAAVIVAMELGVAVVLLVLGAREAPDVD